MARCIHEVMIPMYNPFSNPFSSETTATITALRCVCGCLRSMRHGMECTDPVFKIHCCSYNLNRWSINCRIKRRANMNHRPCKYAVLRPLNIDIVHELLDNYFYWSYPVINTSQGFPEITLCSHPDRYESDFFLSADLIAVTFGGIQCIVCPIPKRQCPFYTDLSCMNSFESGKDPEDA